ncbi:MAG: DNA repair protein RadC [Verrucomicrobia bacterium]|nr:DNA repair protein RadC [Verrucomicrobiota bacterium]MDA1086090.1 DNA repair protein RadC [Verrucomicrobiota bacterium]
MAETEPTQYTIPPRIKDMPERMRPREFVRSVGVRNAPDETLLALVLRSGAQGKNVTELARQLLSDHGSLTELAKASEAELLKYKGMGPTKAQVLLAALEVARRLSDEIIPDRPTVRTPGDVAGIMRETVRTLDKEIFWVLAVDAKNRLKGLPATVSEGLLDASLVHAREVFRPAIQMGSAAVILVHNHPSGDPTPSSEDVRLTRKMVESGKVVDIRVLDHVILGRASHRGEPDFFSMRESGMVSFD